MTAGHVHPTALVESSAIGDRTTIWAFVHIMDGATVGDDCTIGDSVFIETGAHVGSGVVIKNACQLYEGVTVEDCVFLGPGVRFTNDRHPRSRHLPEAEERYGDKTWLLPTRVGYGASLGAGVVVLPGVEIGRFATIAAGAVVAGDVPDHCLSAGVPARPTGWVCRCGQILPVRADAAPGHCSCGLGYRLTESGPMFDGGPP